MSAARLFLTGDADELQRVLATCTFTRMTPERASYLVAFLREGPAFLDNGGALRVGVAIAGGSVLPLVISDGKSDQCYLVSPYVHYVAYLIEEVKKMRPPVASLVVRAALHTFGAASRALAFDRVVSINNWLFTTSLLQSPTTEEIADLAVLLRARFPQHALVYRGLDLRDEPTARALQANGFETLMHRPILEWSPDEPHSKNSRRAVAKNLRLTEGRPFTSRPSDAPTDREIQKIAWMYRMLYVVKHSRYNVEYNQRFFEVVTRTGINFVEFVALRDELCAFVTLCRDGERIIPALIGYDPAVASRTASPYSAAMGCAFRLAMAEKKLLFLSTGVSLYKRRRGARETMEFEAFDVRHLPRRQQAPWLVMKRFLEAAARYVDTSDI
ncbi:MAG: hypothetical protein QM820_43565 [Minicystis sp.]